ncbi:MAG: grasp-with-spasm system SPASM domain peptide maturase [Cytophagaceae bacterium]|jgi:SPASM domain peptide maturase of grasp-with-spasm system|nr:grasp-with-spasm system SPASM domain peptide maturase [Cytophagaceae bacterium]
MLNSNIPFHLKPSVFPVKGYTRSVLLDLHRNIYKFIPNILFSILKEHQGCSVLQIKKFYDKEAGTIIDEYFNFLLDNEFITLSKSIAFLTIDTEYTEPSRISNAVIEIGNTVPFQLIAELSKANCRLVQLRFIRPVTFDFLMDVIREIAPSRINNIHVILFYSDEIKKRWDETLNITVKLTRAYILNAPEYSEYRYGLNNSYIAYCLNSDITYQLHCGTVHPKYFCVTQRMVMESLHVNSCLHKKIFVDASGNVKNCPYNETVLGNFKNQKLTDILDSDSYKSLSEIGKDNIAVCNDCEFRYICLDCRVFIDNLQDKYSRPAKCRYNPYIAKWQGQADYVPVTDWLENNKKNNS